MSDDVKMDQQLISAQVGEIEKKTPSKIISWAALVAFMTSILTSAAYLTGVFFHKQYLAVFKVSPGLFPKSSSEYFLYAYSAIIELMPQIFNTDKKTVLFILTLFVILVAIFGMNRFGKYLDNHRQVKRIRDTVKASNTFDLIGDLLVFPLMGAVLPIYFLFWLFILLLIPAAVGDWTGTRAAKRDLAGFEGGCTKPKDANAYCTDVLSADKLLARGFIVDMSEKYVAIRVDNLTKSIPITNREFVPFTVPPTTPAK